VPTPQIAVAVAEKGGPEDYVNQNWDKLVGAAQTLAELAVEQGQKV
jgi:Na+-translocating ferredoxin:NAD+ oxidoreductase subunit B